VNDKNRFHGNRGVGGSVYVGFRCSPVFADELQREANEQDIARSELIRSILRLGLSTEARRAIDETQEGTT